jgi:membrane protease YdiL (CAAX protease family)
MWPLAVFISLMSGPWSEEFGWRGFALDPLLQRFGTLGGSVLLGLLWGLWHLPLYLMPGTWHAAMGFRLAGFWTFLVLNIGLALVMTWVYLATGRSILTAILLHFAANFSSQLVAPVSDRAEVAHSLLVLAVGLVGCGTAQSQARGGSRPGVNSPMRHDRAGTSQRPR